MEDEKEKISLYQVIIIFLITIVVPTVRSFTIQISQTSGRASWVSVIISTIPCIIYLLILNALMNKLKDKKGKTPQNLMDVFEIVFGKFAGTTLTILYAIWMIFFAAIEVRLFAERLISTSYIYTPIKFFSIFMLLMVFFVTRNKLKYFARFSEIVIEIFVLVILIIFISSISNMEIQNLWPPSEIKGIFLGTINVLNMFNCITYSLFLGDKIKDVKKLKKQGIFAIIATIIICLISVLLTLGTFGKDLIPTISQPFFMAVKVISLFGVVERIESVYLTFGVAIDFVIISYMIIIVSHIFKTKFKLSTRTVAITPICLLVYIISLMLAKNYFSLEILSTRIYYNINLIFGFVIPTLAYIISKARGIIQKRKAEKQINIQIM